MSRRKIIIDKIGRETRRLVLEDGRPVELAIARDNARRIVGNVYLARVVTLQKGLDAAFVDIGLEKNAFLPLQDTPSVLRGASHTSISTQNTVKNGQEIIVQVVKEPGGSKGPRVTMNPALPGHFVVLLPTLPTVGVSRHIEDVEKRNYLQAVGLSACPQGMGVVLRTAAEDATEAEIVEEIGTLEAHWNALARAARTQMPPARLLDEGDLAEQAARDIGGNISFEPFSEEIEAKLVKMLQRKVWLKSGAYLVFDFCEAMTVIDVNSGKFTGKRTQRETLLKLNCEAAQEIATQIRLRDLGGIIVVDFVDMREEEDRVAVLSVFQEALAHDRAKHHVHGFTGAGLLEVTRRPVYHPLHGETMWLCPVCDGAGMTAQAEAQAHTLLRDIRRRRLAGDESEIILHVSGAVANVIQTVGLPDGVHLKGDGK